MKKGGFSIFIEEVFKTIEKNEPIFQSEIWKKLPQYIINSYTKLSLRQSVIKACIELEKEEKITRTPYNPSIKKEEYGGSIAEMEDSELAQKKKGRHDALICVVRR